MKVNCEDIWEDDWENTKIPDLFVNLQDTIKNRERELKVLEERKLMEEDDLTLAKDLFDKTQDKKVSVKYSILIEPVKFVKNENSKELKILQEKKTGTTRKPKSKKQQDKRLKEIYCESQVDEYYEIYGDIEDKYC